MKSNHPRKQHKYQRILVRGGKSVNTYLWRCMHPGCRHYLTEQFIIGAICECWRCEKDFVIDKKTALKKPHCRECTRRKNIVESEPIEIPESPI